MDNTKYQITKTVRFKLEPQFDDKDLVADYVKRDSQNNNNKVIEDFSALYYKMIKHFQDLVFRKKENEPDFMIDNKTGLHVWNGLLEVKYTWLRRYLQNDFYANKPETPKSKKYKINDLEYVKKAFELDCLPKLNGVFENLATIMERPQENYARNAAISLEIAKLKRRTYFEFVKTFVSALAATNKPEIDNDIADLQTELSNFGKQLDSIYAYFLPLQSNGVALMNSSLNYYAMNKSVTMFDKAEKDEQTKLDTYVDDLFKGNLPKELHNLLENKTLDEAYYIIKDWKAKQKSKFLEEIQNGNKETAKAIEPFVQTETYDFEELVRLINLQTKLSNLLSRDKKSTLTYEDKEQICDLLKQPGNEKFAYLTGKESDSLEIYYDFIKSVNKKVKSDKKDFFFVDDNLKDRKNNYIQRYKDVCDYYKQVALKRGQSIAKRDAIEKEKHLIDRLRYWAIIVEKSDGYQYLYLIERNEKDSTKDAHKIIANLPEAKDEHSSNKICFFESLTVSALRKLCFGKADNSFIRTIKRYLNDRIKRENTDALRNDLEKLSLPYEQKGDDDTKIKFYQTVLKHNQTLNLSNYNLDKVVKGTFSSFEDFEIELNKMCYAKIIKTDANVDDVLKGFEPEVYKITSLDIKNTNEVLPKYGDTGNYINHKNTALFKIWQSFWSNKNAEKNYITRLNPEIKVFWRKAKDSRVNKYGKGTPNFDEKKHNRYLKPQYTAAFTISINADSQKLSYAFADTNDKGNVITQFNSNINKNINSQISFGIDAGKIELATLAFVQKCDNTFIPKLFAVTKIRNGEIKGQQGYHPEADKRNTDKVGYLKDGSKREESYKLIDNPSYFLNRDLFVKTFFPKDSTKTEEEKIAEFERTKAECFETELVSAIDLTTAKLFGDVILTNGDYKTFEKLRQLHAERKINEALKEDINAKLEFKNAKEKYTLLPDGKTPKKVEPTSNTIVIEYNGKSDIIYNHRRNHDVFFPYEKVKETLKEKLEKLRAFYKDPKGFGEKVFDMSRLELNINNTRRSLVANMVGVIKHLYDKFCSNQKCFITMENFDPNTYESHRKDFEGDILRPLEWALYTKFQSECFVPPISELLKIREENTNQFGIIKFVSAESTSSSCPKCGKKNPNYDEEKLTKKFKCPHCGFDNKNDDVFGSLDDNDKIAAFNIAKRCFTENLETSFSDQDKTKAMEILKHDAENLQDVKESVKVVVSDEPVSEKTQLVNKNNGKQSYLNRINKGNKKKGRR